MKSSVQSIGRLFLAISVGFAAISTRAKSVHADDSMKVKSTVEETKAQRDARMSWWRDARFGMFIHWGVYSVPAGTYDGKQIPGIGEWIMNRGKIPVAEAPTAYLI